MYHLQVIKEHINITLCTSFGFSTTSRLQHFRPVKELSCYSKIHDFFISIEKKKYNAPCVLMIAYSVAGICTADAV